MNMFDEEIATTIREDGTVEQKRWLTEDVLQTEEMEEVQAACLFGRREEVSDARLRPGSGDGQAQEPPVVERSGSLIRRRQTPAEAFYRERPQRQV